MAVIENEYKQTHYCPFKRNNECCDCALGVRQILSSEYIENSEYYDFHEQLETYYCAISSYVKEITFGNHDFEANDGGFRYVSTGSKKQED